MNPTKPVPVRSERNLRAELLLLSTALVLIVATLVSLSMLCMNLMSSVRAYVNGEALWSKAQKDAVIYLDRYRHARSEAEYREYLNAIRVPQGDHVARIELNRPDFDRRIARQGFLEGRNHPDDVDRMIWLYRAFGSVSYLRKAIGIWERADVDIAELSRLGARLHANISSGSLNDGETDQIVGDINRVNDRLTPLEDSFSQTLGDGGALAARVTSGTPGGRRRCPDSSRRRRDVLPAARSPSGIRTEVPDGLIESANEAIFIADAHTGYMLESNPKGEELLDAPARQFIGTVQPILPETGSAVGYWPKFVASLHEGNGLHQGMRLRAMSGRIVSVEVSANLIRIHGRTMVQSIVRDVTHRINTEKMLRFARDQALEASRAKGQFVANMSHEIRTPMNGALGMLEILLTTDLTAEQREYINIAKDSAESLLSVISDILDFSRIDAGRVKISKADFDLREMTERVMGMLRTEALKKGLHLSCRCDEALPETLSGDVVRIRQVLTNLVSNAIKFTSHGSVDVDIRRRITPDGAEWVRFEVRDTGIGIPSATQAKLFVPFSQGDESTTRKYGGTGLGLAISETTGEADGRRDSGVSSEPGAGSVFQFEIPLAASLIEVPETRFEGARRDRTSATFALAAANL